MSSKAAVRPLMESIRDESQIEAGRRRFLTATTTIAGATAAALFADVLVKNMSPGLEIAAEAAPVDIDVSKIEPGRLVTVVWKKKPVWVLHRPQWMLDTLSKKGLVKRLKDPHSRADQQPAQGFVNGNYRAVKPHIFIAVALCTHMQCVPDFRPGKHSLTPWWYGGFHCPCHGSTFDFSARVFEGSPAPLNIPIPPYYWKSDKIVRIGETSAAGTHENWRPEMW